MLQDPRTAWLILAASIGLTAAAWKISRDSVKGQIQEQFQRRVDESEAAVRERMRHYEQVLRGTVGLFGASDGITREQWAAYVEGLGVDKYLPGIEGLGFAARIPSRALPLHVESMHKEGFESYAVWPATRPGERFPIVFVEPFSGRNLRDFGFDMFSDPVRRTAMLKARDTGESVLTGRVHLEVGGAVDPQPGFLLLLPVYRRGSPPASTAERRQALVGFVFSTFRGHDLLEAIIGQRAQDVGLEIHDGRDANPASILVSTDWIAPPAALGASRFPDLRIDRGIMVADHPWWLRFRAGPQFEPGASLAQPLMVAVGGLFIDVLLFVIIRSLARTQKRAVALAGQMTVGMREAATALREQQAELVRAKDLAEEAASAKSQFLARMSHEMRTPLGGVVGMLDLALMTSLSPDQTEYLETASTSATALLEIINEVLDFSKIEARKLALDSTAFSLRELVGATVRGLAAKAHDKGLELIIELGADTPDRFRGDPMRLRQVITNLVGNAIKFTERGEIVVSVAWDQRNNDKHWLALRIADTGIGVPKAQQQAIFEAFQQADETVARRFGGTGLGLSISAQLVTLMGGKLGVESAPGRGSTFFFDLPLEAEPESDAGGAVPPVLVRPLPADRVVVLASHPRVEELLLRLLAGWGMQPIAAATALEAVIAAERAHATGAPLRWIVVDRDLEPVEASTLFGAFSRFGGEPPCVIALAPMGGPARDRPERLAATPGLAAHRLGVARKPLVESELRALIARLAEGVTRTRTPTPIALPAIPRLRTLRILVAEDNRTNQLIARRLLEVAGQQVTIVADGRAALDALAGARFDLVLMDVRMPEMDGLEATRAIRAREKTGGRRIPIVALTAQALVGDREECIAAGMDDYVTKPLRPDVLFDAIMRAVPGAAD